MNTYTKNTIIGVVALALIITGIWMATKSKNSAELVDNTSGLASSTVSDATPATGSQINDGQTRDANGCITSANFVWDVKIGSCVHASKVSTSTTATTITKPSTPIRLSDPMAQNLCNSKGGQWSEKVRECLGVNKNTCESIGGEFAECASPCRNDPNAQVCTMMCVQVCTIK